MQMSVLIAAFFNANRDPKRSKPVKAEDMSIFAARKEKSAQTPEQHRAVLEALTLMAGGEVVRGG